MIVFDTGAMIMCHVCPCIAVGQTGRDNIRIACVSQFLIENSKVSIKLMHLVYANLDHFSHYILLLPITGAILIAKYALSTDQRNGMKHDGFWEVYT